MKNPVSFFKNYIAGTALGNAKDEFEIAAINLMFNYGIIGMFLGIGYTIMLQAQGYLLHSAINIIGFLLMSVVFAVMRITSNVKLVCILYIFIQLSLNTAWAITLNFKIEPDLLFWMFLSIVIACFILGSRWGIAIAVVVFLQVWFGVINRSADFAYFYIYKDRVPESNVIAMLVPFALNVYALREFVRTREIAERQIQEEKNINEELLLNILPEEVSKELKQKGYADAKQFDEVTVLFTDFKGFTSLAEKLSAHDLVKELNECFSAFDKICVKYGIEKIKTIGDSYMAAGGLPVENKTHADDVVNAALEMRDFIKNKTFEIRIGIHTGNVVAGIVGIRKFQYDIWGDTVNTASRMESSGEAGEVNISETTYQLVKDKFNCVYRGEIEAKNKGKMKMYFVG